MTKIEKYTSESTPFFLFLQWYIAKHKKEKWSVVHMWQENSCWIYQSNTPLKNQKSWRHPKEEFLFPDREWLRLLWKQRRKPVFILLLRESRINTRGFNLSSVKYHSA